MTVISYDKEVIAKFPGIYEYVQNSSIEKFVAFLLHSDYRKAIGLANWIEMMVLNPSKALIQEYHNIPNVDSEKYDERIIAVLNHVVSNTTYVPDSIVWKMNEYWQTPEETLQKRTGDCEDGAILIYCLARQAGIPANRLLLICGDVDDGRGNTGGHCWLGYVPDEYPLNICFIDWCYYYDETEINMRDKFLIIVKDIFQFGYSQVLEQWRRDGSHYKKMWFAFNECGSYTNLRDKNMYL